MSCHTLGFPNAPQLEDSAFWVQRLNTASSIEELVDSVDEKTQKLSLSQDAFAVKLED
ncbi:MAG: cytochrome c5 [Granulosicoccus sp.]|jgi:cytochrome c5